MKEWLPGQKVIPERNEILGRNEVTGNISQIRKVPSRVSEELDLEDFPYAGREESKKQRP